MDLKGCSIVIPGLPNDIALRCLVRVPRKFHGSLRAVSHAWKSMVGSHSFYEERRKHHDLAEESLIIFREIHTDTMSHAGSQFEVKTCLAECFELDLRSHESSHVLASWTHEEAKSMFLRGQVCVQMEESILFVGGYIGFPSFPCTQVLKFCSVRKKMGRRASMLTPRANFAWAVRGDLLYVAGGEIRNGLWVNQAEIYNYKTDQWTPKPSMPKTLRIYWYFVYNNRLFVKGYVEDEACLSSCRIEKVYSYDLNCDDEWREEVDDFMIGNGCAKAACRVVTALNPANKEDCTLVCASLESPFRFFPEDYLCSKFTIRKKQLQRSEWETVESLDKIRSMYSVSLHSSLSTKQAILVIPYDLSAQVSKEKTYIFNCGNNGARACCEDDLILEVCVPCCDCCDACFTSALVSL